MSTAQKDKKFLGRNGALKPLVIARSEGSYLIDEKGKRYIDFYMGWSVGNIGWGQKEIAVAVRKFAGPTYVAPGYMYEGWSELAGLLISIAPSSLKKCFRATGGTEAVEIALQAAMTHTKRTKFISIEGSYHGHSIGAMSVGSSEYRKSFSNLLPGCHKIEVPLDEAAAHKVEKLLQSKDIAALMLEPIIMNLGVQIPEKKFFDIVSAACKKYGTLLIADEVATGFGHTGTMFACEHYGLKPDIMCIAKAIGGGYGALGATLMSAPVARSFESKGDFYSTFGWHPLSVAAATASLKYLLKNKKRIFENARKLSGYFAQRLAAMSFKYTPEIRVKGLAICVDFGHPGYGSAIIKRALPKGLLLADATSNDIVMFPALTIDMKVAKKGLDILESCLQ